MLDTILPFQTWLKQQRKLSGFTQNDLAEHLSCTTSLVRKLESGIRTPSLLIARKLAQIFEIDSSEYPLFISWCLHAPEIPTSITPQSPYPKPNTFKTSPRLLLTHSLIGRQKEIAWIEAFFRKQRGRLLTLVGFSGIGKTSLGLTIGNRLQQYYKTIKVDLEGIDRSDLVLIAISQYLGLGGTTHDIIQAAFQHIIGTENLLLIIDPFEHVLDAAEVIQDILQWCPNMMILVTSQVPLHLREECIYYLRPLSMPKTITSTIHELEQSHAGSLMLERLREHRPHWHIADNQAQSLAYICRSIDGIPLAIELLALRLRWITPQQLRDYINSDYALAQRPLNTVHQRHQSLEYTIERSYELLPEHAQQLFQHLSILADGWNLDEVYHICRALRISNHDTIQKVIQHVEILLERGFILPLATNPKCFRMLRVFRTYGQHLLKFLHTPEQFEYIHQQCSTSYLYFIERLSHQEQNAEWHQQISELLPNCIQALQFNIAHDQGEIAGRIAIACAPYWYRIQAWDEAHYWFKSIYSLSNVNQTNRLDVTRWYANTCYLLKNNTTAQELLFPLLEEYIQIECWSGLTATLNSLGLVSIALGHYIEAQRYMYSAYHLANLHNLSMRYALYNNLGFLAEREGLYQESIDIYFTHRQSIEETSHDWIKGQFWICLGNAYLGLNQPDLANWAIDRAATINDELHSARFTQEILRIRIYTALARDQREQALAITHQLQYVVTDIENQEAIVLSVLASAVLFAAFAKWEIVVQLVAACQHWNEQKLITFHLFEQRIVAHLEQQMISQIETELYEVLLQQGRLMNIEYSLRLIKKTLASLGEFQGMYNLS